MALAARCPHCQALFRVVIDQLKLRDGLVRCGACHTVFDAIGSLGYVDDRTIAEPNDLPAHEPAPDRDGVSGMAGLPVQDDPPGSQPLPQPAVDAPRSSEFEREPAVSPPTVESADLSPSTAEAVDMARALEDTTTRTSTIGPGVEQARVDRLPEDAQSLEPAGAAAEPSFLRADRTRQRATARTLGAAGMLLALLLAGQAAMIWRDELFARIPAARPTLQSFCRLAGCSVGWPTRGNALAVISSDLQQVPGTDLFELTAVIRNRSRTGIALPALELTLSDNTATMLSRRVILAAEYLASSGEAASRIGAGLGADEDLTVQVRLRIQAPQVSAFVVYPFFP